MGQGPSGASQSLAKTVLKICQGGPGASRGKKPEPFRNFQVSMPYNGSVGLSQPASDLQALLSDQEFCSKHKLPGPDKIVVQDWEHPVRAPSKETKGLEPSPNPNWHSSGLDKSSLQTKSNCSRLEASSQGAV